MFVCEPEYIRLPSPVRYIVVAVNVLEENVILLPPYALNPIPTTFPDTLPIDTTEYSDRTALSDADVTIRFEINTLEKVTAYRPRDRLPEQVIFDVQEKFDAYTCIAAGKHTGTSWYLQRPFKHPF